MSSINPPAGGAPPAPPRDDEAVPVAIFDEQDTPLPPRAPMLVARGALPEGLGATAGQLPPPAEEGSARSGELRPRPVELPGMQLLRIDEVLSEAPAEGTVAARGESAPSPQSRAEAGAGATPSVAVTSRGAAAERRGHPAVFIAQPEVEGELQALEPARLMGWAIATGFCGCLWLAPYGVMQPVGGPVDHPSSTPHRELYFEHGMLLGAYSTVLGDGIAEVLAQAFSSRQAQRARSVVAGAPPRNLREQLSRLCRARLLDAKDASLRLHGYVVELVYRALAPTPGRYRLLPRTLTTGERVTPPVSPRLLLVEGLRRRTSLDQLQRHLGPPETQPLPIAGALAQEGGMVLRDIGLTPAEEVALRCFDGQTSLAELMRRAELGEHATYVLAYALLCLGALAVPGALPLPLRSTGPLRPPLPPPAPPSRAATAATELSAALARVQAKYSQVECADYFALLELPLDASAAEVRRAYERLQPQFLPKAVPYRCRMAMDRELRQILLLLDEARAILGSDELRAAYRAGQRQSA